VKQTKAIIMTIVIMAIALVGLYACGGDAPTATPVPPTATAVPPSPTAAPATPTTAAAPATSTTSGSALATATTSSGGGSNGSGNASADEVAAIQEALTSAKDLKSYHFLADVKPSEIVTQPVNVEGDYVAPNTAYFKGTIGDKNVEQIVVGDHIFVKDASGSWVEQQKPVVDSSDPIQAFNAGNIVTSANPLDGIDSIFTGVKSYTKEGTETMDGAQVTKFGFKLDIADMMGGGSMPEGVTLSSTDLGGGDLWVDTNTKLLHKINLQLNLGPLMELLSQAFGSISGTPTPGGAAPTPFPQMAVNLALTISKHNDPSITIPLTDEMKQIASATATPEAFPTTEEVPTVGGDATPAEAATPSGSDQVVPGKIGDTLTIGDVAFTVNDVQRSSDGNLAPSDGNEYVLINVTVQNNGTEDLTLSGLLSFALVDSTGADQQYAIGAKYNNMFDTVTAGKAIAAGQKVTGELGYEVKKGATDLTLKLMPNLLSDTTYFAVAIDK
jgi:hypothetical protein